MWRASPRTSSHSHQLFGGEGGGADVGDLEHRHMDVTHDERLSELSQTISSGIFSLCVDPEEMCELRA